MTPFGPTGLQFHGTVAGIQSDWTMTPFGPTGFQFHGKVAGIQSDWTQTPFGPTGWQYHGSGSAFIGVGCTGFRFLGN